MNRNTFDAIGRALRQHHRFAILSHIRPDGDALGSTLALALSLNELGKDVRAWNEEGMLEKYGFLAGAELLTPPPNAPEEFDVAIALDTATKNRLGKAAEAVREIWGGSFLVAIIPTLLTGTTSTSLQQQLVQMAPEIETLIHGKNDELPALVRKVIQIRDGEAAA